jgi:hypothetical protein
MTRAVPMISIVAIALSLIGCGRSRPIEGATSLPSPGAAPVETASEPRFEVHEITIGGHGSTVPLALAETDGGIVLFTTEPTGLGRYLLDLDGATVTQAEVVPIERYSNLAAYDHVHDRLWWTGASDQLRFPEGHRDGEFPRGDLVVTLSSSIAHTAGLSEIIRVCPPPAGGLAGGLAGDRGPLCDHEIRVLLPAFDGLVLAGHLSERVGQASGAPWIGFADTGGALTVDRRLPQGMGVAWVDALARSDAGVLAVAWSGRGEPAHPSFLLFDGPTLEPIATASRVTPSWTATPWSAAVTAPDGSFWVALTTTRRELTIVAIARDGSITSEHAIDGAELPTSSVQSLAVRGAEPWLMIASPYPRSHPMLWTSRIDPATGAVPQRHEIPLPSDFAPWRMLTLEHGFVLAGRVSLEQLLVVWIPA